MKTLVFPKKLFFENSSFWYLNSGCVLKQLFDITEKKTGTENQQNVILDHVLSGDIYFRLLKKKHELEINKFLME